MKITKTQLKQIVLEELKDTMSEMAMDEMAFSMADVDAAAANVDKFGDRRRAEQADETYTKLIAEFRHLVNEMGGVYVVDPQQRIGQREMRMGMYDPYNRDLAVLYRVLETEVEKLQNWKGHPKIENNSSALQSNRDKEPVQRLKIQADKIVKKLEQIADYAEEQNNAPAIDSDEPFLSLKNAKYISDMAQKLRNEWVTSQFGR